MSDSGITGFSDEKQVSSETIDTQKTAKKSRKKLILGVLLILFIIGGIASLGFAKSSIDKFRERGLFGFMSERIIKELSLSEQQKTEVNKIRDIVKAKMNANRQKRQDMALEMENMFRGDTFDRQKALELAKQQQADREEMHTFMIDEMAKFHSILTPEQRQKAADLMKEKREKWGNSDKRKDGKREGPGMRD